MLVTTGGNAGAGTFPRDILVGKPKYNLINNILKFN